ncbi:Uncharacterised protein [Citrobacter freundii]|nr:Uncharacterised protein [Citrobacter freundii]
MYPAKRRAETDVGVSPDSSVTSPTPAASISSRGIRFLRDSMPTLLQTGITGHTPIIAGRTLQSFRAQFAANSLRNLPGFTVRLPRCLAGNIVAAQRFNRATQTRGIHRLAFCNRRPRAL